jgi:prevent-host-death family protein
MREVQASDAKTHLPALLDAVERGETVVITRHGRRVARIVPEHEKRQEEVDRAMAEIEAIRGRSKRLSRKEIREWIDEGRE